MKTHATLPRSGLQILRCQLGLEIDPRHLPLRLIDGVMPWHTFRHSLTSLGKQALSLEETKNLARHADILTTSNFHGGFSLDAKRAAQERLVEFVRQAAKKQPSVAAL